MASALTHTPRSLRRCAANPTVWLILFMAVLGVYRFSLIGSGHFLWGDECTYLCASALIDDVADGAYRSGAAHLFEARGRPGFVLISVIPTLAQRVIGGLLHVEPAALGAYDIASGFNVLVSLGLTLCVYGLGRVWTGSRWYALLIAVLLSLLVHANVWIRHLMPYHQSMLLMLAALLCVSSTPLKSVKVVRNAVVAGAFSAFGYACYPGYYAFVAINAVVLLIVSRRRFGAMTAFAGGAVTVMAAVELLARFGGKSYFLNMRVLSRTIAHGDFQEGYVFVWRYLRDVEGGAGVTLFALFLTFVALVLWRGRANLVRPARVAIAAAIVAYLFHATMGVVFEKMVFYGRIVGMYLPFLVGGAVLVVMQLRSARLRRTAVVALLTVSAWSFVTFAWQYARVTYPADLLLAVMAQRGHGVSYPPQVLWGLSGGEPDSIEELDRQLTMVADVRPDGLDNPPEYLASHERASADATPFIGVNFKWVPYVRKEDMRFLVPPGYELVADEPHPNTFPATNYEGRKPWERKRLMRRRYRMRIYERTGDNRRWTATSRR